jgi:hypothetical protein
MKRLTALLIGFALRHAGYWLVEGGHRIEAWGDVESVKAGGTD